MMMTERNGGGFMKILNGGDDLSSKFQRMLPPRFLEETSHRISDEVELKMVWGSSWMIPLVRNQRGQVFFEKQRWCEFVEDNLVLSEARSVTFEHVRDDYLFVTIFGENDVGIMEEPRPRSCCTSPGTDSF